MTLDRIIKILLSILFILCLLDMPYGFYQLVRFIAMVGFSILAYQSYRKEDYLAVILFVSLGILFQPLIKISLGREIWNAVDVVVSFILIASIFIKGKQSN